MNMVKNKGFTLLEVLASAVVMSIVLVLAVTALSQFNQVAGRFGNNFIETKHQVLVLNRLIEVIESALDYYVADDQGKHVLLFNGTPMRATLASLKAFTEPDTSALIELRVLQDANNTSLVKLVAIEVPLYQNLVYEVNQMPDFSSGKQVTIFTGAESITLSYLGPKNVRQIVAPQDDQNFNTLLEWDTKYDGMETGYLPSKIKVEVKWEANLIQSYIFETKAFNYAKRDFVLSPER